MILFLAKTDKNIENCKKKNINSYKELLDFYNKNGDNLKRFEQIIIDEDIIEDEKIISDFKEKFMNNITVHRSLKKDNSIKEKEIKTQLENTIMHSDEQDIPSKIKTTEEIILPEEKENISFSQLKKELPLNENPEEKIEIKNKLLEEFNKLNDKKAITIENENTSTKDTPIEKAGLFENKKQKILDKISKSKEKQTASQKKENETIQKNDDIKKEEIRDSIVEKVIHDKNEIVEKANQLKELTQNYKNTSHIEKEKLDELENKHYTPNIQNEEILKLNLNQEKEKTTNKIEFKLPSIPKIPKIQSKKEKKKEIISKNNNDTILIQTSKQKGEIAVAGGLQGVGTTYCSFKIAHSYPKLRIGYIQYCEKELEISILKDAQSNGYINDNITIYSYNERLDAYKQNDLVIVDYGYFDKNDKQLMVDFERANNKYFVVNFSFNKFTSINNALNYAEDSNKFITIFNMYDESNLIQLQKKFKELNIMVFGFDINI
ncbi:hypothetical protein [Peptoanaerobacter stomatis]